MNDLIYALSQTFRSTQKITVDVTTEQCCKKCKGTGEITPEADADFAPIPGGPVATNFKEEAYECPHCDGSGSWITKGNLTVTTESRKSERAKNKKP